MIKPSVTAINHLLPLTKLITLAGHGLDTIREVLEHP